MSTIPEALDALAAGRMIVVTDDEHRENEGDIIAAARSITPDQIAFMAAHARGLICLPLSMDRAADLGLEPMVPAADNTDNHGTAFTVSIDHCTTGTGISAADRAATARAAGDPATRPMDFRRPGHLFPLIARPGGVLERPGHTEATVDLVRLAGAGSVGLCCEIMGDDGTMLAGSALVEFAATHDLPLITIADLIAYRRATGDISPGAPRHNGDNQHVRAIVSRGTSISFPTASGMTRLIPYVEVHNERTPDLSSAERDSTAAPHRAQPGRNPHLAGNTGEPHLAQVTGQPHGRALVRIHSECLTGDALGSQRCDCGEQLRTAQRCIADAGEGVLLYLRQEGRGIGLENKLHAYALQDDGLDTVDANRALGLPDDARGYGIAAAILRDLGITEVDLLTNNPQKIAQLEAHGITVVSRVPLEIPPTPADWDYLHTKQQRMGHLLHIGTLTQ